MRLVAVYLIGLVFGLGIMLGGMADPAKVLNFFDIAGTWDPSLIFVMGGALVVTFLGYRVVLRRPGPLFAGEFSVPASNRIDLRLVGGSVVFGIGWGITGFCPGGALPAVGTLDPGVLVFMGSLVAGMTGTRAFNRWREFRPTPGGQSA